jgi:N-acyl-phosphatidylethanolamine-hydrolysing phospholipase D
MARSRSRSKSPTPAHHVKNFSGTTYKNPWPSAEPITWTGLLAQRSFPLSWPKEQLHNHPKARELKVITPDWGASALKAKRSEKSQCIIGTWLGHASALAELPLMGTASPNESLYLLFDPIFSLRAGPTQWTGPRRFNDPPCQVSDLPGCDAVFISHNHYDHLDLSTIKALLARFPTARYFVPLGNRSWLSSSSIPSDLIHELDWWLYREYSLEDFGHAPSPPTSTPTQTTLRFTCVPAQHNSGRTGADTNRTLWSGWVIEQILRSTDESSNSSSSSHGTIYHAGDTGYRRTPSGPPCPVFKEIGSKFSTIDLSFLPIWRGGTLGFISNFGLRLNHEDVPGTFHASPKDAADIHLDVGSRNSVPVHFGTFVGSENETHEAVIEFVEACAERGIGNSVIEEGGSDKGWAGVLDIGESIAVDI